MSADIEDFMEKGACASGYGDDEGDCNEATYIHTGIAASPSLKGKKKREKQFRMSFAVFMNST